MIMPFKFWCQKVLPLVYDDSLSYYELLCKVVNHLNSMGEEVNRTEQALVDLKNYVENFFDSADFDKIVEDSLDKMVTNGELDDVFAKSEVSGNLTNIYIADYAKETSVMDATAVTKVGNKYYSILCYKDAYRQTNHNDTGLVKIMEIDDNVNRFVSESEIEVGHGNSMCYDRKKERFLIAPIDTFASGASVSLQKLISYDAYFDGNSKAYIDTPETVYGVTCDENGDVYFLTYWDHIYKLNDDDTYTKVCDVSPSLAAGNGTKQTFDYNQGFAVQNGMFYVSRGYGYIAYGRLSTGKILGYRTVDVWDMAHRRYLGELEDFEFGTDGALYAQRTCHITDVTLVGTVVEIPVKEIVNKAFNVQFHDTNNTMTISDATIAKPQNLNAELKHPSQINMLAKGLSAGGLNVNTEFEFDKIVFTVPVIVNVTKMICKQIVANNADVSINGNSTNRITFTTAGVQHFKCEKTGSFNFCGYTLNVITQGEDCVVGVATLKPLTKIRNIPGVRDSSNNSYDFKIEDVTPEYSNSIFFGIQEVFHATE